MGCDDESEEAKPAAKRTAPKKVAEESDEDDEPAPKKAKAEGGAPAKGEGKGKNRDEDGLTAFVRGLPWAVDEATLRKDFAECGTITRLSLPLNDEGKPRGIAFISYETKEG